MTRSWSTLGGMRLWMVLGLVVVWGCGEDTAAFDGGQDANVFDANSDAASDVASDAASDMASDAVSDMPIDAATDAPDSADGLTSCLNMGESLPLIGVRAIAVDGDLALVGSDALRAFRVSSGEELGSVAVVAVEVLAGDGRLIANDGVDALSLTLGEAGLEVVGRVDISGEASIALDADRLVSFRHPLAARIAELEITSLAVLAAPERLGSTTVTGKMPAHVVTSENHAFMVDPEQGLSVVDFTDARAPETRSSISVSGVTLDSRLGAAGTFVYVGSTEGILAFDIRTLSAPSPAGRFRGGTRMAIRGDLIATVALSAAGAELVILRLDGLGGAEELETMPVRAVTAIAWTETGLWIGHAGGLTTVDWRCP